MKPKEVQETYQSEVEASVDSRSGPGSSFNSNSLSNANSNEVSAVQV